jgi:hypothetical protein
MRHGGDEGRIRRRRADLLVDRRADPAPDSRKRTPETMDMTAVADGSRWNTLTM